VAAGAVNGFTYTAARRAVRYAIPAAGRRGLRIPRRSSYDANIKGENDAGQ